MGSAESVVVMAHWQVIEADLAVVLEHAAALRAKSLAEPGCLGYEVLQNTGERTSLVIVERYRDVEAQQAHLESPHYLEHVAGVIRPLLAGRHVEILRVRPLTDKG
jgi:quinol monooxygenase YgiN